MLNQVITLYQLTHSLISPYKKTTENLFKLNNAEVLCVIPELDASPSVNDGVGSKTGLKGAVEIKLNDGVTTTEKKTLTLLYAQRNTSMHMRLITLTSWKQLCSLFYNQSYQVCIRKHHFSFCYYMVHLVHGYFRLWSLPGVKKNPMELWIQEGIMGQTGNRPVLPLGYVNFIKVNFRTIKCMKLIVSLFPERCANIY